MATAAAVLMVVFLGISLLGIVSATLTTGFLQRVQGQERAAEQADLAALEEREDAFTDALLEKLDRLEAQVAALTAALATRGT